MGDDLKMEGDMIASVHYTGTLKDGEQFDSSEGRDPLTFLVGHMQMIPGFEEEMMGAGVGESRTFTFQCR
jgi:FKBP-type peptidyl-prolyl cis-trans isomerase